MRIFSARILVGFLFVLALVVIPATVQAQVISTPTPTTAPAATATPIPTTAAVATPTTASAVEPTPVVLVTGPRETFAIVSIASMALVVLGLTFFFLF